MFTIVVAQEDTFIFQTEGDAVPFERKFFQKLSALDNTRPVAVLAFSDIAKSAL
jgi:hypothetical protein